MKLSDILKESPQFWKQLGKDLCELIRKRVQEYHRNVQSQPFDKYSEQYKRYKMRGMLRMTDNLKLKAYKGTSITSNSGKPDMTLTGKTMRNLKVHSASNDGCVIGWFELQGDIVRKLYKHKNYKIVNPDTKPYFSNDEERFLFESINREIDRKIRDYCSMPITITGARP